MSDGGSRNYLSPEYLNVPCCDLGVDMRDCWKPSVWFLSRRTMSQLRGTIPEFGLNRLFGNGVRFKKRELVRMMVSYFQKVFSFSKLASDQKQARDWLPEAMHFPAIDPDRQEAAQEEEAQPRPEDGAGELAEAA